MLYISSRRSDEGLVPPMKWHIGEAYPNMDKSPVYTFQADGDELELIKTVIKAKSTVTLEEMLNYLAQKNVSVSSVLAVYNSNKGRSLEEVVKVIYNTIKEEEEGQYGEDNEDRIYGR